MASSLDSLDFAGSPANPGSSVIHLCISVKRTVYGSSSGNLSVNAMAMSSKLSQSKVGAMSVCLSVVGFASVVFVPVRNFHDDVGCSIGNRLAAETGLRRDAGSFVQFIQLRVRRFVARFQTFSHDHMASRASADPAARMVESGLDSFRKIQNAAGQAVVAVWNFLRINLERLAAGQKCDFKFLGRRLVLRFFDVWVCATHVVSPQFRNI